MTSGSETRVFLVRHGAARGAEGIAVGQIDLGLSQAGADSVRRLARSWRGGPPDRLVASDLTRATETAALLAEGWGIEAATDERLREMSYGDWDGQLWEEIRRRDGERLGEWMSAFWHHRAPGGEGLHDVARRAADWLEDVLAGVAGETVVAVAHGGPIRSLLCHALGLPLEHAFHLRLDHGQVSALATGRRGLEVAFVNADRFPGEPCRQATGW